MEMKIFEFTMKYSIIFTISALIAYLFFSFIVYMLLKDKETFLYHINFELLSIARSAVTLMIGFYILSYLAIVQLGAEFYFKDPSNINKTSADYFKYIVRVAYQDREEL